MAATEQAVSRERLSSALLCARRHFFIQHAPITTLAVLFVGFSPTFCLILFILFSTRRFLESGSAIGGNPKDEGRRTEMFEHTLLS
jgi:hypothetical protein